jgi:hypothetical protein
MESVIEKFLKDHPEYRPIEVLIPENCAHVYHAKSDSDLHIVLDDNGNVVEVYQLTDDLTWDLK